MDHRIDFSAVDALLRDAVQRGVVPGAGVCIRSAAKTRHVSSLAARNYVHARGLPQMKQCGIWQA